MKKFILAFIILIAVFVYYNQAVKASEKTKEINGASKVKYESGMVVEKWGFIGRTGKVLIEPQFKRAYDFSEGLASVKFKEKEKWGYIDKTGKVVIEPKFDWAPRFSEGLARVGVGKKLRNIKSPKLDLSFRFPKEDRNKS